MLCFQAVLIWNVPSPLSDVFRFGFNTWSQWWGVTVKGSRLTGVTLIWTLAALIPACGVTMWHTQDDHTSPQSTKYTHMQRGQEYLRRLQFTRRFRGMALRAWKMTFTLDDWINYPHFEDRSTLQQAILPGSVLCFKDFCRMKTIESLIHMTVRSRYIGTNLKRNQASVS